MSIPLPPAREVTFDQLISPALFADAVVVACPRLHLALSASVTGRSRAIGRLEDAGVVLNARDLELLAVGAGATTRADSAQVAAQWLQRALTIARERRVNVTLEGTFRSPALVIGIAKLFSDAGYETRVATVAERATEVRMADASRRFDAELRRRRTAIPHPTGSSESVAPLLSAIVDSRTLDRVTVFDRDGLTVVDAGQEDLTYASAPEAFASAARQPFGTLRSAAWLSELRHMTRFLAQQGPAPRWAVEELIALHQLALTDVVPELPIPADSETRHVQESRLSATLAVLRDSVTSAPPEEQTLGVILPTVEDAGLSR